jgi:protocatechuate 3,4-dioxygenase alpha subunit
LKNEDELVPTPSQTVGPFFHVGCTNTHAVSCLATASANGERIRLIVRILDGDGAPLPDAMIELWQADAAGKYNHPDDPRGSTDAHCTGFGRLGTDADGMCVFETIRPGCVPGNDGATQAPHVNVSIFGRGINTRLATRIYFENDPANSDDPVIALVPEQRRPTLMAKPVLSRPGEWRFEVHLCGEQETVFFDI